MAPKGRAALAKRQKDRADLKGQKIIWIGIAASEANIQRLGTLLMLADWPMVLEARAEDQLEAVVPGGEGFEATPMEFDYNAIRNSIVKALQALLTVRPDVKPRVAALIKQHGGERLSLVPDNNLPELYTALDLLGKEITG